MMIYVVCLPPSFPGDLFGAALVANVDRECSCGTLPAGPHGPLRDTAALIVAGVRSRRGGAPNIQRGAGAAADGDGHRLDRGRGRTGKLLPDRVRPTGDSFADLPDDVTGGTVGQTRMSNLKGFGECFPVRQGFLILSPEDVDHRPSAVRGSRKTAAVVSRTEEGLAPMKMSPTTLSLCAICLTLCMVSAGWGANYTELEADGTATNNSTASAETVPAAAFTTPVPGNVFDPPGYPTASVQARGGPYGTDTVT